jgi:hypothetical protein
MDMENALNRTSQGQQSRQETQRNTLRSSAIFVVSSGSTMKYREYYTAVPGDKNTRNCLNSAVPNSATQS